MENYYDITMTPWWPWRCLKSPASRLFTQPFIQAQIKETIKASRHWSLWGEVIGDRWIPAQRASNAENISILWRHHGLWMTLLLQFTASFASGDMWGLTAPSHCPHQCWLAINMISRNTLQWIVPHTDHKICLKILMFETMVNWVFRTLG